MLLQLPKELVINVSSYLDFKDKLSLSLACHWLRDVLLECSLYRELSVSGGLQTTREVIRQFKEKKLNGSQVKLLKLHLGHLSNQLYRRLPVIFPNVSELVNAKNIDSSLANYYYGSFLHQFGEMGNDSHEGERDEYVLEALLKWKDKIVKYDMRNGFLQMTYLLQTNIFSRLICLALTPSISFFQKTVDVKLFDCLKNAPALKTLIIYDCTINLEFIENLHAASPRLESLELFKVNITIQSDTLPRNIEPALDLSTLILDRTTSITDRHCIFLDYIIAKYKRLCCFELYSGFVPYHEHDHIFLSSEIYHHPDQDATRHAYSIEGARLLLTLPRTLKTLKMDGDLFDNIIEALDNSVARPKTLEFYDRRNRRPSQMISTIFVNPKQLEYLQKSISLTSLTAGFSPTLQLHQEIISVSISKLTIAINGMPSNNIGLNWLLASFPSLSELVIVSSTSMIVGSETDRVPYPHLHKLAISKDISTDNIHPKLFDYVRTVAPNITDLDWVLSGDLRMLNTNRSGYGEPHKTKTRKTETSAFSGPFCPPAPQASTSDQGVFHNSITGHYFLPPPPPMPLFGESEDMHIRLPSVPSLPLFQSDFNQGSSPLHPLTPWRTQPTVSLYPPVNYHLYPTTEQYRSPFMIHPPIELNQDPTVTIPFSGTVQQQLQHSHNNYYTDNTLPISTQGTSFTTHIYDSQTSWSAQYQQQQWQEEEGGGGGGGGGEEVVVIEEEEKKEEEKKDTSDDVFYEMDLSGRKMKNLQLYTDFIMDFNTKVLFEIKTLEKTYVCYLCSIAGGGYSITTSNIPAFQQVCVPKVVVKCDKIKNLMLDQHTVILDTQMVDMINNQTHTLEDSSFLAWL